jgi:hypothetical protein
MKARLLTITVAALVLLGMLTPSAGAQAPSAPAPGQALPFRPASPNYYQVKAALDARAPQGPADATGALAAPGPGAPVIGPNAQGVTSTCNCSPSDATGAIGPTEYIEMVNLNVGVYDRSLNLLSSNTEAGFSGTSFANGDGEVMWDNSQSRFFYSQLFINGSNDNELLFGFSKGSAPSANASDWCSYHSKFGVYGTAFPDYPKLGVTNDFILMGVNRFTSITGVYAASDVAWATKPPAGVITTCPALSTFMTGAQTSLKNSDNSLAFTPVPGNNADPSGTGYVVASHDVGSGGSASSLSVYTVTKDPITGKPVFSPATNVPVTSYSMPPSAPQKGTSDVLDTLDGRLTNAVTAVDPAQGGATAVWTQQTVAASSGGLGAEVRWYEINPTTGALFQSGIIHSPSLYVFMGAVSPDRNGALGQYGSNMVAGFSASSSSIFPAVGTVSKIGAGPQSAPALVAKSPKADKDFTCTAPFGPPCRWGDYAGASPDPASPGGGTEGMVWLSNMREGSATTNPNWTTQNYGVVP